MYKKKSTVVVSRGVEGISPYKHSGESIDVVVVLSDVKHIGWGAFSDCVKLTKVYFRGDGVISIGVRAFQGCSVKRVRIPDSVISIGMGAFRYTNISFISFPGHFTSEQVLHLGLNAGCRVERRELAILPPRWQLQDNIFKSLNSLDQGLVRAFKAFVLCCEFAATEKTLPKFPTLLMRKLYDYTRRVYIGTMGVDYEDLLSEPASAQAFRDTQVIAYRKQAGCLFDNDLDTQP